MVRRGSRSSTHPSRPALAGGSRRWTGPGRRFASHAGSRCRRPRAHPSRTASTGARPIASPMANAPTKASPAPVVSTAWTTGVSTHASSPPRGTTSAPRSPSVTTSDTASRSLRARTAATSSPWDPVSALPAIRPNSGAFGTSQSVTATSSGETAAAGAGLSTVVAPIRRAAANPAAVVLCGISN